MSWEALVKGVIVASGGTSLFVVGCGVGVYLFGNDTDDPIGSCTSICLDDKKAMKEANAKNPYHSVGLGYCSITLQQDVRAFGFIVGLNGGFSALSSQGQGLSNSIKVFLAGGYEFHTVDIYSSKVDERNVDGAYFGMAITDQPSCESAKKKKSSYACSADSVCEDLPSGGYSCRCRTYYTNDNILPSAGSRPNKADDENAYIMDGCQQPAQYNPNHKGDCTKFCGNTSIDFPFGVEKGCYASEKFRLDCTLENITILDHGGDNHEGAKLIVENISVNEGYLTVRETKNNSRNGNGELAVTWNSSDGHGEVEDFSSDGFHLSKECGMQLLWFVNNLTCSKAMSKQRSASYTCRSSNSTCIIVNQLTMQLGYRCQCSQGFHGNPYILNGCQGKHITTSGTNYLQLHGRFSKYMK